MEPLTFLWVRSFQSSSGCVLSSRHHVSAGFVLYLKCCENTSCTCSMFAVNTTSLPPCWKSSQAFGPQTVKKKCVAHTSAVGGGWLLFPSPLQAAAISPLLFWSLKRGVSACLNVTDCAKAASQTQRAIKKKYHRSCSNRSADCPLSPLPGVEAGTAKHSLHDFSMTRHKNGAFFLSFLLRRLCGSRMNCTAANIQHSCVDGFKWYASVLTSRHLWFSCSSLSASLHFARYVLCCLWRRSQVLQCFWLNRSVL